LLYICAWAVVEVGLGFLLKPVLPQLVAGAFGLLISICFFVVGVRVFRGAQEAIAPRRSWWRLTAGPQSGYLLGVLALLAAVTLAIDSATASSAKLGAAPISIAESVIAFVLAILYVNSATRLLRLNRKRQTSAVGANE
jgi:hypothetical protein